MFLLSQGKVQVQNYLGSCFWAAKPKKSAWSFHPELLPSTEQVLIFVTWYTLPYVTNLGLHTAYFLSRLYISWSQELCFRVEISAKFSTTEWAVKIFKSKPPIYQASKMFVSVIVRVLSWELSRSFGSS